MHKSQIFFATQTGNSQEVAEKLQEDLEASGIEVPCADIFDSDPENISE
ncbi:MAG TPA: flavodoxin, partial [Verrucomicrobiales bacterium]|nr:flavodoxin [Verrucomicrobiales bacterium]